MTDKNKVFTLLGASSHTKDKERAKLDYYATDPRSLEKLLGKLKEDGIEINNKIWECATGENHLKDVLISHGYDVIGTDIVDRSNCVDEIVDFLSLTENPYPGRDILTNPPYEKALEFAEKAIELIEGGGRVILLLRIQFLEGKKRYKFFKKHNPTYVYVHSSRIKCAKNGDFNEQKTSSATCYAWYIFEKEFKGDTIVRWLG